MMFMVCTCKWRVSSINRWVVNGLHGLNMRLTSSVLPWLFSAWAASDAHGLLLEDSDPTGFKSKKCVEAKAAAGIKVLEIPRRSPEPSGRKLTSGWGTESSSDHRRAWVSTGIRCQTQANVAKASVNRVRPQSNTHLPVEYQLNTQLNTQLKTSGLWWKGF